MTRRLKHRRTDPACRRFVGRGDVWSLRRWLYERNRGRTCPACSARRLELRPESTQGNFEEWLKSVAWDRRGSVL